MSTSRQHLPPEEIILNGETYTLNQAEDEDLYQWFEESKVGEFTRFYSQYVFHKANGCYAAYVNDISNGWYI